jgi:hypothetical protein
MSVFDCVQLSYQQVVYMGHAQEWNNDAECLIADIVLEDEDDDEIRGRFLVPRPHLRWHPPWHVGATCADHPSL